MKVRINTQFRPVISSLDWLFNVPLDYIQEKGRNASVSIAGEWADLKNFCRSTVNRVRTSTSNGWENLSARRHGFYVDDFSLATLHYVKQRNGDAKIDDTISAANRLSNVYLFETEAGHRLESLRRRQFIDFQRVDLDGATYNLAIQPRGQVALDAALLSPHRGGFLVKPESPAPLSEFERATLAAMRERILVDCEYSGSKRKNSPYLMLQLAKTTGKIPGNSQLRESVDELEKRGLVERIQVTDDKQTLYYHRVTDAGNKELQPGAPAHASSGPPSRTPSGPPPEDTTIRHTSLRWSVLAQRALKPQQEPPASTPPPPAPVKKSSLPPATKSPFSDTELALLHLIQEQDGIADRNILHQFNRRTSAGLTPGKIMQALHGLEARNCVSFCHDTVIFQEGPFPQTSRSERPPIKTTVHGPYHTREATIRWNSPTPVQVERPHQTFVQIEEEGVKALAEARRSSADDAFYLKRPSFSLREQDYLVLRAMQELNADNIDYWNGRTRDFPLIGAQIIRAGGSNPKGKISDTIEKLERKGLITLAEKKGGTMPINYYDVTEVGEMALQQIYVDRAVAGQKRLRMPWQPRYKIETSPQPRLSFSSLYSLNSPSR
jgi:DNA-binding PadR family transcriptional regulator